MGQALGLESADLFGRPRAHQAALRTEGGEGEEQAQEAKKEAEKAPAPEAKAEQQETA